MDTLGLIWGLAVLPADIQDRDGAKVVLARVREALPRLRVIWADGAYKAVVDWVRESLGWVLTTVLRPVGVKGYVHLPKRWIAERTFGWFGRYRRLSKDYEHHPHNSETWIYIAMLHRMCRFQLPDPNDNDRLRRRPKLKKTRI